MINLINKFNAINPSAVENHSERLWQHISGSSSSRVTVAHMQICNSLKSLMKMAHTTQHVGPLGAQTPMSEQLKDTVLCTLSRKEVSVQRSTSSLKYHINLKHTSVASTAANTSPGLRQTALPSFSSLFARSK